MDTRLSRHDAGPTEVSDSSLERSSDFSERRRRRMQVPKSKPKTSESRLKKAEFARSS